MPFPGGGPGGYHGRTPTDPQQPKLPAARRSPLQPRDDTLIRLHPDAAEPPRPDAADIVAALRRPAFPIFGLPPGWAGRRFVAGWDEVAGLATRIELGHLDEPADALLVVHVSPRPEPDRVPADQAAHSLHVEAVQWTRARGLELAAEPREGRMDVSIDGRPVPFDYRAEGPLWLMRARHGSIGLVLRGHNLAPDGVELVQLPDAGSYLEGFRP